MLAVCPFLSLNLVRTQETSTSFHYYATIRANKSNPKFSTPHKVPDAEESQGAAAQPVLPSDCPSGLRTGLMQVQC